jgi:quercetin dioxygenase-like cupin family protein
MNSTPKHIRWDEVERETLNPLLERQYITAGNLTLARFLLRKGAVVPMHHHRNEQLTYVVEGALKFFLEGRELVVSSGEVLCIPPDAPHGVEALQDTSVVDIFWPVREDWISHDDAYLRGTK